MKVITAPERLAIQSTALFLAGSIEQDTAEKWQAKIIEATNGLNITLLNPRRKNWDASWKENIENPPFKEQVNWELDALELADWIIFYFDKATKSPITLLELGLFATSNKLIVCCPEGYWKKGNVDIICQRHQIPQVANLNDLIAWLYQKFENENRRSRI